MNAALIGAGLALGFAGSPHCMAMCGAACAGIGGGCGRRTGALHAGRAAGYAAAGALAAGSLALLGHWAQWAPALRPLWTALHAGLLVLGLWLLFSGRQPRWAGRAAAPQAGGWQAVRGPKAAAAAGIAWPLLPCGLLQTALLLAALANGPAGGAAVMLGFWAGSLPALTLAPALWARLVRLPALALRAPSAGTAAPWALRVAGALMLASSAWVLGAGLIRSAAQWCLAGLA